MNIFFQIIILSTFRNPVFINLFYKESGLGLGDESSQSHHFKIILFGMQIMRDVSWLLPATCGLELL